MNIRKEIEELIFNKYGLKVNDPFSIAKQSLKLWEELEELKKAKTKEQIECELGDVLFVEQTLQILFDVSSYEADYANDSKERDTDNLDLIAKLLNKCDKKACREIFCHASYLVHNYYEKHVDSKPETDLLQQTILKNQGRSGKIINGCYVKSEDI